MQWVVTIILDTVFDSQQKAEEALRGLGGKYVYADEVEKKTSNVIGNNIVCVFIESV
jgi:hypothetical protein